jgi:chorismate mutase
MPCRGVRGATTVESNAREEILEESRKLLALMIRSNDILSEDVASALFTVTRDLNAEYPALAARQLGWINVPLLCGYEIDVPGGLTRCIRVLLHWNTDKPQHDIVHVYIKDARKLRPDLSKIPPVDFRELEQWIEQHMAEYTESLRGKNLAAESEPTNDRTRDDEHRGYEDAT